MASKVNQYDRFYTSPKYYRESEEAQQTRLSAELEEAHLQHALKCGREALWYLGTRQILGTSYSPIEASVAVEGRLKLQHVYPEFIPVVVDLVVGQFTRQ